MKRDQAHPTDRTPDADAITEPIGAGVAASTTAQEGDLDPTTARILKALDRPPRPPAPTPDLRASSDGGDFVAYSSPPRTDEERRQQARAQLAALIQESPPADTPAHVSTHTVAPRVRSPRPPWALAWFASAVIVATVAVIWTSSTTSPTALQQRTLEAPIAPTADLVPEAKSTAQTQPSEKLAPAPRVSDMPLSPRPEPAPIVSSRAPHGELRSPPLAVAPPSTTERGAPTRSTHRAQPTQSTPSPPDELIEHPW